MWKPILHADIAVVPRPLLDLGTAGGGVITDRGQGQAPDNI